MLFKKVSFNCSELNGGFDHEYIFTRIEVS
jgi:hypothetical protein